jgi:hypothetical protein
MRKYSFFIVLPWLAALLFFGCGSDPGLTELSQLYTEKIAAVNEAAQALAAARDTEQAARELGKGYKILREAVAREEFIFNRYPRTRETPEVKQLQEDYLAASEKFSREVEALPKRLVADRTLIEALKKMKSRVDPL